MSREKRTRGGQPGNQNARTHGYYSDALSDRDRIKYDEASKIDDLGNEISLLRSKISGAVENGESYKTIFSGLTLFSRLCSVNEKISEQKYISRFIEKHERLLAKYRAICDSQGRICMENDYKINFYEEVEPEEVDDPVQLASPDSTEPSPCEGETNSLDNRGSQAVTEEGMAESSIPTPPSDDVTPETGSVELAENDGSVPHDFIPPEGLSYIEPYREGQDGPTGTGGFILDEINELIIPLPVRDKSYMANVEKLRKEIRKAHELIDKVERPSLQQRDLESE